MFGTKKGMSESSTRGDPAMLPCKITFHDGITRVVLFAEKVCAEPQMQSSSHTWRELPYSQPTLENSGSCLNEQCDPLQGDRLSEHSVPSGEIIPSDIPRENKVVMGGKACVGASLEGILDRGFGSESHLTSTSNTESAFDYMPVADLQSEELPALPMPIRKRLSDSRIVSITKNEYGFAALFWKDSQSL